MREEKETLLKKYYHLTLQLVNEMDDASVDFIEHLLDERQTCIEEVNKLDQNAEQILMNSAMRAQHLRIRPLESTLQAKLMEGQQKVLLNIHSLKKEKNVKQQYCEPLFVPSGLFYDKSK